MNQNPYDAIGIRLTPQEYELVQMGLTSVASHAKDTGESDIYNRCMDLMTRMQQYVLAGKGIPEELAKSYAEKFQRAMMEGNHKTIVVTMRQWLAALIRLEPDPANAIAKHITELFFTGVQQVQTQVGSTILGTVAKKLNTLDAQYDWTDAKSVLDYIVTWIEHGKESLENGEEPWKGDPNLEVH